MTKTKAEDLSQTPLWIPMSEHLVIRTSLLRSYMNDPAACLFRYFKGLVVQPKSYTTMGRCTHEAAEHGNRAKLKKGKDEKLSVLQDVFNERWKEQVKQTVFAEDEDPEEIHSEGIKKIVPAFHQEIYKKLEPLYVEEPFELEIPELNATVTGTIDLVEKDHMIRDLKTKKRTPRWDEAIKSFQGRSYMIGYKTKFKKEPSGFMLDCIIRKKEPEVISTKPVKYTQLRTDEYLETTKAIIRNLRMGIFFPKREGNFFCSEKFCGFHEICHKGSWMQRIPFTRIYGSNQAVDDGGGEDD